MTEQCQLSWFCCLLSSSNVSTRVGAELSRALADRMIEVGPPQSGYGFFDDLHGHGSAGDFSAALLGRLAAHHGKAGPEFVKSLMSMHAKNGTAIDGFVKARRSAFLRRVAKAVSLQREHERVTGYFASIYAAGALAAHLDVFPVKREALVAAVMSCLSDHIARTGGQQGDGFSELARRLRMWLQKQRVWVVDLDVDEPRSCDGLDAFRWTAGGKARIGLRSELLDEILGGRSASATFKHELHRRNAIATAGGGKSGMKYVVKRAIGKERVPLVQIREDTIRERP